jgi:CRISPR-associated protein Csb1
MTASAAHWSSAGFARNGRKEDTSMPETKTITPSTVLEGESPVVLVATLAPVAALDRFQPAGFPEVGHVIYKAPRTKDGTLWEDNVCIVDSAASMANHLESVCMRGPHDYELVEELAAMPYLRCVTGEPEKGKLPADKREVVVTSLTEGHRIAAEYFLGTRVKKGKKRVWDGKGGQRIEGDQINPGSFGDELVNEFGIELDGYANAHPPAQKWWNVFKTIFRYDPNALVHGVLFPQWQIKIPRVLTAHLEAFGAGRVDRSGIKFDRLGKTTSGQPIFAVDDAIAREIRATFVLDVALVHSFGRKNGNSVLGLSDKQKEFLVALALWKIKRMLERPFRFRSGCHLKCVSLKQGEDQVEIQVNIKEAIDAAGFEEPRITDVYWSREELYREAEEKESEGEGEGEDEGDEEQAED